MFIIQSSQDNKKKINLKSNVNVFLVFLSIS